MEAVSYNLKAGLSLDKLLPNLTTEQKQMVEKFAEDGFSEDELQKLQDGGVDIDVIKNNSTKKQLGTATEKDIAAKVTELKAKYANSDKEIKGLETLINDGVLAELAEAGFSKFQIVDVISQLFPSLDIKNLDNGQYQVPNGTQETSPVYKKFVAELLSATGDNKEIQASREKILNLTTQIRNNNRHLQVLESTITALQMDIEKKINEAIDKSKEIAEEQKEEAKEAVAKNLEAYTNSNGKMSYEDFQKSLSDDLDGIASDSQKTLSSVVLKMVQAERKMSILSGYMTNIKSLMDTNTVLSADLASEQENLSSLMETQAQSGLKADPDCQPCDPIGFVSNGTRYDFFKDTDGNGDLSNENEFLGAQDGFDEMKVLDTNNDGIVDKNELANSNLKVVQTNADGSQEIKNAADIFGDNDSIDLKSYQEQNTKMNNGNTLLGTFNVNHNGQNIEGYQTLDEIDWLDKNYDFSDKADGIGRFAQGDPEAIEAIDFSEKYNELEAKTNELKTKMDEAYDSIGFDKNSIKQAADLAESQGNLKAKSIEADFEATAKKEAAEAEEAKEAEEAAAELEAAEEAAKLEEEKEDEENNPFA